jgi:endonuclease YncB( thermonuclease family)
MLMRLLAFPALLLAAAPAFADPLVGAMGAVDGATLLHENRQIRLWGIEAPDVSRPGGEASRAHLAGLIDGVDVRCVDTGGRSAGRVVAICRMPTGKDIARLMIQSGFAIDHARVSRGYYQQDMEIAEAAGRGLWGDGPAVAAAPPQEPLEATPPEPASFETASTVAAPAAEVSQAAPEPDLPALQPVPATAVAALSQAQAQAEPEEPAVAAVETPVGATEPPAAPAWPDDLRLVIRDIQLAPAIRVEQLASTVPDPMDRAAEVPVPAQPAYWLQLGALDAETAAVAEWQRLSAAYAQLLDPYDPVIQRADLGDRGIFWRLRVGFSERPQAVALCLSLREAGEDCIVRAGVD